MKKKKAADVMTEDVITVSPEMKIKEVSKLFTEKGISGAPVLEDDKLIGIVSGGDLIVKNENVKFPNYVYFLDSVFYLDSFKEFEKDFKKILEMKVADVMTTDIITVTPDDSIETVANLFIDKEIKRVPVTKDKQLVGIITRADIIRYMSEDE
ncbi:CBS domain-containing protein [Natroniella sulfidigena]|uniref:CBS domain-containing protein n=1 Tax=Natroniella sulfidigena TaxID=723921 RepID=UPI00200AE552|nr:CBS domain-containing protein [Natroniella sulfidigena]MCK8816144.1 CBS domain-containing protein [Natroniella sulfidigena]